MFETFFICVMEWTITGKPVQAWLADATSISRKTWDAGGPIRATAKARAAKEIQEHCIQRLREKGMSETEAEAWLLSFPDATDEAPYCLSRLIRMFALSDEPPPETLALATRMDELAHELGNSKSNGNFAAYKQALLNAPLVDRNYFADTERELGIDGIPRALRQAQMADNWEGLENSIQIVTVNLLVSLMACWDLEFCRTYSPLMKPFPFFETVMLRLVNDQYENPKLGRDGIHRPTKVLLDLLAMMGDWIRHHGTKPLRKIQVREMAIWLETGNPQIPAQKLWNWRRGRDAFLIDDLEVVWRRFTGAYDDEARNRTIPPSPLPLFVAAQVWEHMLVEIDRKKRAEKFFVMQPWYLWWWEYHRARLAAKGITWGDHPWPACVRNQSSWSGARLPDSSRSSQSSGRSSKSRDSQ